MTINPITENEIKLFFTKWWNTTNQQLQLVTLGQIQIQADPPLDLLLSSPIGLALLHLAETTEKQPLWSQTEARIILSQDHPLRLRNCPILDQSNHLRSTNPRHFLANPDWLSHLERPVVGRTRPAGLPQRGCRIERTFTQFAQSAHFTRSDAVLARPK